MSSWTWGQKTSPVSGHRLQNCCQPVNYVIYVYAVIGTRPLFPTYTKQNKTKQKANNSDTRVGGDAIGDHKLETFFEPKNTYFSPKYMTYALKYYCLRCCHENVNNFQFKFSKEFRIELLHTIWCILTMFSWLTPRNNKLRLPQVGYLQVYIDSKRVSILIGAVLLTLPMV